MEVRGGRWSDPGGGGAVSDGGEDITEDEADEEAAAAAAASECRACVVARFSMSRLLSEMCLAPSSGSLSVPTTDENRRL